MGSLVAELAEKLSSATNSLDFDEQTMFLNTSADTVGIGTNAPASKLDVRGTMQVGVDDTGYDVKFFGATAGSYMLWDESIDDLILGGAAQIGIGTTAPSETLHIEGTTSDVLIKNTGSTAVKLYGDCNAGSDEGFLMDISGRWNGTRVGVIGFTAGPDTTNKDDGSIVFYTASPTLAERMRIDHSGNVGIGTSVPVTDLTIDGTITLKEQADADGDTAAYGQIWVNTATPNELYYTNDAGDDFAIAGVSKQVTGMQWNQHQTESGDQTVSNSTFYGFGTIYNISVPDGQSVLVEGSGGMIEYDANNSWSPVINYATSSFGSATAGTFGYGTGSNSAANKTIIGPTAAVYENNTGSTVTLYYRAGLKGWGSNVTARWYVDNNDYIAIFLKATRFIT